MSELEKKSNSDNASVLESKERAVFCARMLYASRAADICILHVGEVLHITDYFVIATGGSVRQVKGMTSFLEDELKKKKIKILGLEGYEAGRWVLIDIEDVVIHLMVGDVRSFYDLELLWGDCPRISWHTEKE